MAFMAVLRLCFLALTQAAAGRDSSDLLNIFALVGDAVILKCGLPSIQSCSSISWSMSGQFGSISELVKAGRVMPPYALRLHVLQDCSLKINHLTYEDAHIYSCHDGKMNSSVSLEFLQISEKTVPAEGTTEIHCSLNSHIGHGMCKHTDTLFKWSTEDNTPLDGSRFNIKNISGCFSKLIIHQKLTDHYRKWKCQLFQNDAFKASISYMTTIRDGIQEVFAAVGESVSLSCGNTSSLGVNGSVQWAVGGRPLPRDTTLYFSKGSSSLVISKVNPVHAEDYQCSESTGQQQVLNTIRLHTLDISSEHEPGGENLTLICVLTCAGECEKNVSLSWFGSDKNSWQSMNISSLQSQLVLPAPSVASDGLTCSVLREGEVMASKKWYTTSPLRTAVWLALPLGALICLAAGGVCMHMKRKRSKKAGNEQSRMSMAHIYDIIQNEDNEEAPQQREFKGEAATNTDSFYDLLQAVNFH